LDILRVIAKEPDCLEAIIHEIRLGAGADRRLNGYLSSIESDLTKQAQQRGRNSQSSEGEARRLAERLAVALEASLLVRYGSSAATDAFCSSRIEGN
jgi:putative acyl-CoA dehydrogenase